LIKNRRVIGKVRLQNIQVAVQVEIAHAQPRWRDCIASTDDKRCR
jgi:hypothetical protein